MERLRKQYKLFVLLSGPARGFIKQGLDTLGVSYRHEVVPHYWDITSLYHCLDVYLVSAREEGGPKAILEALATGVPLVSTNVGMAPDLIRHGENGLLAEPDDIDRLAENVARLIDEPELRHQLITNGVTDVSAYDWPQIAARYYQELYLPLISGKA
jgi:glycosyltransferase involved in cell wall biosynthesis